MVAHIDHVAKTAHDVLRDTEDDDQKKNEMQRQWETRRSSFDDLRDQRQFFLEVILVRHVENFLSYLAALLYEIFTQRPETLRSSDKVEVANVLRHESIESLVQEMAEKKVDGLSYSSFDDLTAFFRERFHLELTTDEELPIIKKAVETRNISVHNRCRINKRFVARTGASDDALGKVRQLSIADLDEVVPLLAVMAKRLDREARRKLRLKGIRYQPVARAPVVRDSVSPSTTAVISKAEAAGGPDRA